MWRTQKVSTAATFRYFLRTKLHWSEEIKICFEITFASCNVLIRRFENKTESIFSCWVEFKNRSKIIYNISLRLSVAYDFTALNYITKWRSCNKLKTIDDSWIRGKNSLALLIGEGMSREKSKLMALRGLFRISRSLLLHQNPQFCFDWSFTSGRVFSDSLTEGCKLVVLQEIDC